MINKIFKSEKGQALVELAFILPILLMIVFGITEFGRVFGTQLILANSARDATRYASVGATDLEIINRIEGSSTVLDSTKLNISISPSDTSRVRGEAVTVKIQYPVDIYAPVISNIIGDPFIAKGEAIMRME
ncbi:MAG: hypothetical protein VR72_08925 [Clostridiaceae bacterium BRH_c20a]|nr:MAG: hypothetical protein VR72_08925 [Clostridiaceae bacterium BRH_c20a]